MTMDKQPWTPEPYTDADIDTCRDHWVAIADARWLATLDARDAEIARLRKLVLDFVEEVTGEL